MSINPKMWDDKHFVALPTDQAKLLWCYLLTGNNDGVPGLIRGGPGTFADAMRWDRAVTVAALDELLKATFIEYDLEARLLRVPGAPKYRGCGNANVLKGWLRRWREVPESPLKYSHVESIRAAAEGKKFYETGWAETFGPIKLPEPSKQVPLFLLGPAPRSETNESEPLNGYPNGSLNGSGMGSETNITATYSGTETETYSETVERERPRVADPIERGMIASELWRLQEELRGELAPNVTPREPTRQDLQPIMEALERYTRADLENSLRVNAATAANKPEKAQYFNGYNNWHPESLRRTVGQVVPTSSGRQSVRGRKSFKGGSAL
jgi:hypothetical protein